MASRIARKPKGKRANLEAWIERERPSQVGEAEFAVIRAELAPVSESYLRKLLRESGVPLSPMVEGVRQGSFDDLAGSLLTLTVEYEQRAPGERAAVRQLVITAKDHARWAAKDPAKRVEKDEMALWLMTWLENPPLFPEWVRLRRARL